MKGIILFQSKYGSTKKYAQWLSESTGFPAVDTRQAMLEHVKEYDTVILAGGIYASGIAGLSFLKKNIDELKGKRISVLCVGASPFTESAFEQIRNHNLKDKLQGLPCFYARGAWDEEKMTLVDRTLCRFLHRTLKKKEPDSLEVWEEALLTSFGEKCDWTDPEYLTPLFASLEY